MNTQERIQAALERAGVTGDGPVTQAQVNQAVAALEQINSEQSTPTPPAASGPEPWRVPADVSDRPLAIELLMETGLNRKQANEAFSLSGIGEGFKEKIAEKRALYQERADHQNRLAWEQSPEGRRQAAEAALAAEKERAELVELGSALLRESGEFDPNDSPENILKLSGLLPQTPDPGDSLEANIEAASKPHSSQATD
jgi:hypothetical protein